MALIVNGEIIDESLIAEEVLRLRPDYQKVFQDQSPEKQEAQLKDWAKENVIERILIQQAVGKDQRKIPVKMIRETFEKMKKEHGGTNAFYQKFGLTKTDDPKIKKDVDLQLRVERLIGEITEDVPKPSVDEASSYYNENIGKYTIPEQVRAAHIVKYVNESTSPKQAREAILEVQKDLKSGKPFEALADELSDCPGNGGDLGYFTRGQMVQAFEDVVFSMNPNQISGVFETEFGFHIAKVMDKKSSQPVEFEQAKGGIIRQLHEELRNKKIEDFVDRLKEKAEIVHFVQEQRPSPEIKTTTQPLEGEPSDQTPTKSLNSILVKPAGPDCNMSCDYCFYLEKAELFPTTQVHRMSEDVLETMIKQALEQSGPSISFGWQGGEPTLMGLPFFQKAVDFQKKYGQGQIVGNGLQTNGILIDAKWVQFLKTYNFLVGLSLDGPEHVHNKYRFMRGGGGSWNRVVDRAKLMLDAGVAVNALSVVNDYSVQFPREIYEFHKELGLSFQQYIPCVETDRQDPKMAAPFSVSPEKYGPFLCTLFDLWMADFKNDKPTTSIRFFDSVFYRYVDAPPPECTLLPICGVYVVVEHDGGIYSCDFFVEPKWKLGNIMDDRLIDTLNSERQESFGKMKAALPDACIECRWIKHCQGGCPKDRMRDPRDERLSHFCASYKMFFEHSDSQMQKLAEAWKQEQMMTTEQTPVTKAMQDGKIKAGRNDPCPCGSGKKFKKCCGEMVS